MKTPQTYEIIRLIITAPGRAKLLRAADNFIRSKTKFKNLCDLIDHAGQEEMDAAREVLSELTGLLKSGEIAMIEGSLKQ